MEFARCSGLGRRLVGNAVTIGNLLASIIGAGPGEVAMHQNVSICQSIVASCFDWNGPRNKLVTDG